jgi:hypothetical protein
MILPASSLPCRRRLAFALLAALAAPCALAQVTIDGKIDPS